MFDKILFLGTGAADWSTPDENGEYRRLSSVLINDTLLIDPGPHIFDFARDFNCEKLLDSVKDVLITHSHDDHLSPQSLKKLCMQNKNVRIWGNQNIAKKIPQTEGIHFYPIELFKKVKIDHYYVVPLIANHTTEMPEEIPYHYIIQTPLGKTLFYGCDGAWLMKKTWMEMLKYKFDMMIFDCTIGNAEGDYRIFEHNSITMVKQICDTIRNVDLLNKNGKLVVSHLAKTLHQSHKNTENYLSEYGIITAYDGLTEKY